MSAESEALHRIIEGDPAEAYRILCDFLPGELQAFRDQLESLRYLAGEALALHESQTAKHPPYGGLTGRPGG